MIDLKRLILSILVFSLLISPVIASDPLLIWQKDMYGAVSDIDFDSIMNMVVVSDESGNITSYSYDGNTTNWIKDTGAVYVKELLLGTSGSKIGYRTSASDGDMTYLDATLGTTLWSPTYTAGWGTAVDIAMPTDASKLLTTFANKAKLYNTAGTDIGNITPPTGTWNNGIISMDTGTYMVMSRASNATLYLYKYGYGETWVNTEHTAEGYDGYDYRRYIVCPTGTSLYFSVTRNSISESLPSILYISTTDEPTITNIRFSDTNMNALSYTMVYDSYYQLYNIKITKGSSITGIYMYYGA